MSFVSGRCSTTAIALALVAGLGVTPAAWAQTAPAAPVAADESRTIADLQRQIDELKAMVTALQAAQAQPAPAPVTTAAQAPAPATTLAQSAPPPAAPRSAAAG